MEAEAIELKNNVDAAAKQLNLSSLTNELDDLKTNSSQPDFWQDSTYAAAVMQRISKLESRIYPWIELRESINDLVELTKLQDDKLKDELTHNLEVAQKKFAALKGQLMLSGPYDDHGAVMAISAGAGGTDAQDWTQMLFRMYSRYFDKNGWKYTVVDESPGEEAGLKSVVLEVDGNDFIYGKLRSEHGVHRLVRLSPFNADNLRQTSFAKVEIAPKIDTPEEVVIDDKDLKIDVYRSGGHGGQSVNTTDSAVRVTHIPSGISIAIQNERSQLQNKETALTILRSRLAQLQLEQHAKELGQIKGPNQSAEWGNQIRSYVLHPYKQVKDLRTRYESSDIEGVLAGNIDDFINSYLEQNIVIENSSE